MWWIVWKPNAIRFCSLCFNRQNYNITTRQSRMMQMTIWYHAPVLHICFQRSHDGVHTTQYNYSSIIKYEYELNWVKSVIKKENSFHSQLFYISNSTSVISTAKTESSKCYERKTQSFGFTSFYLHHNYKIVIWPSPKPLKELVSKHRGHHQVSSVEWKAKVTNQNTFVKFVSIDEEG